MPKPVRSYPLRLVGISHYQDAIADAAIGDPVRILAEHGNPHDAGALVAIDAADRTLGYVPRDNWIRRAIADEGKGASATVGELAAGEGGVTLIVLAVTLDSDEPVQSRDYGPPA